MDILLKNFPNRGVPVLEADKIAILIHGRGDSGENFLEITRNFQNGKIHFIAPESNIPTWYPLSFMAPTHQNEPYLSDSLEIIHKTIQSLQILGIPTSKIFLIGFSQGACLALEYVARNALHYGGIAAFTGGLIGKEINLNHYKGDFQKTRIFLGTSDMDPHVPLNRVCESKSILISMGAQVILKVFPGRMHSINPEEIHWVNKNFFNHSTQ